MGVVFLREVTRLAPTFIGGQTQGSPNISKFSVEVGHPVSRVKRAMEGEGDCFGVHNLLIEQWVVEECWEDFYCSWSRPES